MSARQVALEHYRRRRRLVADAARAAQRAWRRVDRADIAGSWLAQLPRLMVVLTGAQLAAVQTADEYLTEVLAEQGVDPAADGRVNVDALVGVASDGRDLDTLLYQPALAASAALAEGATVPRALAAGQATLDMIVRTQVADAGRVADGVATVARQRATGYVRMLVGRSCSRCIILAGRWYRWNAGFDRHPRCDCIHVPGREATVGDVVTDPKAAFEAMSRDEQDRVFTRAGAEAIRLGADIGQVVNARRGARGLAPAGARITAEEARALRGGRRRGRLEAVDVYGQRVYVTTEGVTTRGIAGARLGARETGVRVGGQRYRSARTPRLMPESILRIAGDDRAEAIRLLKRFGYII